MKKFYIMNDDVNGIMIREIVPFYDDERNDEDYVVSQVGKNANIVFALNRERICDADKICDKLIELGLSID